MIDCYVERGVILMISNIDVCLFVMQHLHYVEAAFGRSCVYQSKMIFVFVYKIDVCSTN